MPLSSRSCGQERVRPVMDYQISLLCHQAAQRRHISRFGSPLTAHSFFFKVADAEARRVCKSTEQEGLKTVGEKGAGRVGGHRGREEGPDCEGGREPWTDVHSRLRESPPPVPAPMKGTV